MAAPVPAVQAQRAHQNAGRLPPHVAQYGAPAAVPVPNQQGLQFLPSRFPLPDADAEWWEIDEAIREHYVTSVMQPHVTECAHKFVAELGAGLNTCRRLRNEYEGGSDVILTVVGSLGSGIATKYSDVDICVRFAKSPVSVPSGEPRDLRVLRAIADFVARTEHIRVTKIFDTRVPILRFTIKRGYIQFCVEISYYNMASLRSSELIRTYCEMEPVLPALILWTKKWAKTCDISDATRKALPQYGYTIMLVHFLQREVVLPFLQQPPWFDEKFEGKTHSAGKLFLRFLEYFSEFDYRNQMISMRTRHTTPNAGLRGRFMTIENPFSLTHNVAMFIQKPMFDHILKSIRKSKEVFESLAIRNALTLTAPQESFFKNLGVSLLNACYVYKTPELRRCSFCQRLGHYRQNCSRMRSIRVEFSPPINVQPNPAHVNPPVALPQPDARQILAQGG